MTPIGKLMNKLADAVSNGVGSFFNMIQNLNMIHMGIVSLAVLLLAAYCLRGTPTRGV